MEEKNNNEDSDLEILKNESNSTKTGMKIYMLCAYINK